MRTVNKHVAGAATPHGDMKPSKVTVIVLMLCVMFVTLSGCDSPGKLGPLRRDGPPGMTTHAGEQRLWLLFKQEESWRYTYQTRYHFELHGFDTRTAQRVTCAAGATSDWRA